MLGRKFYTHWRTKAEPNITQPVSNGKIISLLTPSITCQLAYLNHITPLLQSQFSKFIKKPSIDACFGQQKLYREHQYHFLYTIIQQLTTADHKHPDTPEINFRVHIQKYAATQSCTTHQVSHSLDLADQEGSLPLQSLNTWNELLLSTCEPPLCPAVRLCTIKQNNTLIIFHF